MLASLDCKWPNLAWIDTGTSGAHHCLVDHIWILLLAGGQVDEGNDDLAKLVADRSALWKRKPLIKEHNFQLRLILYRFTIKGAMRYNKTLTSRTLTHGVSTNGGRDNWNDLRWFCPHELAQRETSSKTLLLLIESTRKRLDGIISAYQTWFPIRWQSSCCLRPPNCRHSSARRLVGCDRWTWLGLQAKRGWNMYALCFVEKERKNFPHTRRMEMSCENCLGVPYCGCL
jgi:hypothetical protein